VLGVEGEIQRTIMPILMVAHNTINNNLSFSDSDLSEEPLDFTMSKFKSSTPMKHPLYYQFAGESSPNRDDREQGKVAGMTKTRIIYSRTPFGESVQMQYKTVSAIA
jgi:hypothetical protein